MFDDEFLFTRSWKIDIFRLSVGLIWCKARADIPVSIATDPDLWIPDEQVVQLVPELDELLLSFGLLGLDHAKSIGAGGGQGNC